MAVHAAAFSVVSESVLVMRHVGVRLSTRRLLSDTMSAWLSARHRSGGDASSSGRFLDIGRVADVVINEAVTVHDVFPYLCFQTVCGGASNRTSSSPGGGGVVLVFPTLRPGLSLLSRAYVDVHEGLFGEALGTVSDASGSGLTLKSARVVRGEVVVGGSGGNGGEGFSPSRAPAKGSGGVGSDAIPTYTWGIDRWAVPEGPASGDGWWPHEGDGWLAAGDPASPALSILMVSDFFLPNTGGVELHVYSLAQCLIRRGHKVTVLTHAYGDRCGVRYMTNGLKVYYAPRVPVYNGATCPDIFGNFKLLRLILLRERITIVHAHQTFSVMGHEAVFNARTMGYKCVFTDHSLFGFSDASSIHMNKLLVLTLADCNHVVCVSHTAKENTVLRSGAPPRRVSVIPNAVEAARFLPDVTKRAAGRVTVAVTARLAYRKGVHLLAAVIPRACAAFPEVDFLIAGDAPMRKHLEDVTHMHGLTERVTLLGNVPHNSVRDMLQRAHVFLNCYLTESFCIALLEAACCGCLVVATGVGGVPEVLPPDMLFLSEADADALVEALRDAINALRGDDAAVASSSAAAPANPWVIHDRVAAMYSWDDVAARVELVYECAHGTRDTVLGRLVRLHGCGPFAGKLFCAVAAVDFMYWWWVEWWRPAASVEAAPDFIPDDGCFFVDEDERA
jgi:phosphatidylinositol glycan class A protein